MKSMKKDNNGFTLVELLIAIVVIAIVMIPIYSNFRESTYLNGKAKAAMDATNMASNIMEGLSAFTPEEIILGFYSEDERHISNNALPALNILPNEITSVTSYGDIDPSSVTITTDADGNITDTAAQIGFDTSALTAGGSGYSYTGAHYAVTANGGFVAAKSAEYLEVNNSNNDKYYFYIEGAKQARGTYDVLLELDASADSGYSGDTNNDGTIDTGSGEEVRYNDYEAAEITSINPLFDGVYTDSSNARSEADAYFVSNKSSTYYYQTFSAGDFYPYMKRTLTITIDRDAEGYAVVTASEAYDLDVSRGDVSLAVSHTWVNLANSVDSTSYVPSSGVTVFDGSTYKQEPRDIYIYYLPNYDSTTTSVLDNFEIDNTADVSVNIHLIRLKTDETSDANEIAYRSALTINEDRSNGFQTQVYSNLRDNITYTDSAANATNRNDFTRCKVTINGTAISSATADYTAVVHENGGVKTEVKDRLYSVRIFIYEEGAARNGFNREDLVTTFDGSSSE